jgi:hypothetical protein
MWEPLNVGAASAAMGALGNLAIAGIAGSHMKKKSRH